MRRLRLEMKKLIRKLGIVAMLCMVSTGAFAQGRDQDKRPPKEPVKVVVPDRKDKPPQPPPKPKGDDKRGKP
jgi:hypothetical protein